jgi:hypothetical protein
VRTTPSAGAAARATGGLEIEVAYRMADRTIDLERRSTPRCERLVCIQSGRYDRDGRIPGWEPFDSGSPGPVWLIPVEITYRTEQGTTTMGTIDALRHSGTGLSHVL